MVNTDIVIRTLRGGRTASLTKLQLLPVAQKMKIERLLVGGYILIEVDTSTGQTLVSVITSENFFDRMDDLTSLFDPSLEIANVSDGITYLSAIPSERARVTYHRNTGNNRGGFFPYYNMTNLDMKKFGIFTPEQYESAMYDPKDKEFTPSSEQVELREMIMDNCLMHALKQTKKFK